MNNYSVTWEDPKGEKKPIHVNITVNGPNVVVASIQRADRFQPNFNLDYFAEESFGASPNVLLAVNTVIDNVKKERAKHKEAEERTMGKPKPEKTTRVTVTIEFG